MRTLVLALFALMLGLGLGLWSAGTGRIQAWTPESLQPWLAKLGLSGSQEEKSGGPEEKEEERKILYWVAPMDPNYRRDKPGKSPMGMDLVPVYADEAGGDENAVKIDPAVVQNLGVVTAKVERGPLWRRIDAVASIRVDDNRVAHINLRTNGWIERMTVKSAGERVRKGDLLLELYSPDLINAQEEYVRALSGGNPPLIRASRERLIALGLNEDQIEALRRSRKPQRLVKVYAPQDGIVSSLKMGEGMFVKPASTIMTLADLSQVWVLAEVFERQANWVAVGQPAEVRLPYLPGRVWDGKVEYIYPELNPKTRTLRVRLVFDNPGELLKPNMYGKAVIYGGPKWGVLSVPRQALIRSGSGDRLIIALGKGRFEAREVLVGIESGDWVEILEGVNEGEEVVTSAQFLIDSEASIAGSLVRLEARREPPQSVEARGTVNRIMAAANRINISHDPIPELNWPVMTMDFTVAPGTIPPDLKPGQPVHFTLQQQPGSGWIITHLMVLEGQP